MIRIKPVENVHLSKHFRYYWYCVTVCILINFGMSPPSKCIVRLGLDPNIQKDINNKQCLEREGVQVFSNGSPFLVCWVFLLFWCSKGMLEFVVSSMHAMQM